MCKKETASAWKYPGIIPHDYKGDCNHIETGGGCNCELCIYQMECLGISIKGKPVSTAVLKEGGTTEEFACLVQFGINCFCKECDKIEKDFTTNNF